LVAVIPQRSKAIDMQHERAIPDEDQEQKVETGQLSIDGPPENTLKRLLPPANLFMRVIRRPELRKIVPLADTRIYETGRRAHTCRHDQIPCTFWLLVSDA